MCFSSKSTSSTFSPARNVLSMTRPCRMCLSLVRTKAPPLPGLTCWKSTMVYGCPSCWILSPFLNSAVDTCMRSTFPFLGLGPERLVQALPDPGIARVLLHEAQEDLCRLVGEPLLEAEGAEAHGRERVVLEDAAEGRALAGATAGLERLQGEPRLAVPRLELDHALKMLPGLVPPAGLAMNIRGQAMGLRVLRARFQDADELSERLFRIALVEICPGQDEARRRVLREADEALLAEPDGLSRPADFAIGVGKRGKGQPSWVFGEPLFVATDCAGRHGIGGGYGPSDLGDRVRHGSSFICAKGARVNAFPRLPAPAWRDRLAQMQGDADSASARPHVSDWERFLFPVAAVVLTFLCYLPALANGFIDWDDSPLLLRNPHYRGLGLDQLRWMFTTRLMGHWMPLNWISFGLDHAVWSMTPSGYHLTNALLHAINAAVVYALASKLLLLSLPELSSDRMRVRLGALVAALTFSLHPLRVESVAWVTERRDVLSGLFFLLAIWAYLRYCEARTAERGGGRRPYWAAVVLCGLALMSKVMAVSLPVILLLLDIYPLRRLRGGPRGWLGPAARAVLMEKLPFVALCAGASALALWAQLAGGRPVPP